MKLVYFARVQLAKQQILAELKDIAGLELAVTTTVPETLEALKGADALLATHTPAAEAAPIVDALKRPDNTVRWIHFNSAGQDGYAGNGLPDTIEATYAAGAVAPTVAEHAMALALALTRQLPAIVRNSDQKRWDRNQISPKTRALEGGTMAIVGFGHIGKAVAERAHGFGMRIITVSRKAEAHPLIAEAFRIEDIDEAFSQADVIVMAMALNAETRHLVGHAELARCKSTAILVNIARGGLIDQTALRNALDNEVIAAAALDATTEEPLPATDPLWESRNIIISPHASAGGSVASQGRIATAAAENVRRYIEGRPLLNPVSLR
jgi:phosphoglycerate dehydrogenase-like enzyme